MLRLGTSATEIFLRLQHDSWSGHPLEPAIYRNLPQRNGMQDVQICDSEVDNCSTKIIKVTLEVLPLSFTPRATDCRVVYCFGLVTCLYPTQE